MGAGLLDTLFLAGLTAREEAGRLVVSPADRITPAMRRMIQTSKAAILAAIQDQEPRRRWSIRTPDGKSWSVTRCPPVAAGELAQSWPPGSVLEPLADQPRPTDSPAMPDALEGKIRAWLDSVGEADPAIIGEVLDLCADNPAILAMYLALAGDVPDELPSRNENTCGNCRNAERTGHPHLAGCRVGEPPPNCGWFWDSDVRSCDQWEAKP